MRFWIELYLHTAVRNAILGLESLDRRIHPYRNLPY